MTTGTSDGTVAVLTGYTDPDATAPTPGLTRTEAIVAPTAGEASVPAERGPGPR